MKNIFQIFLKNGKMKEKVGKVFPYVILTLKEENDEHVGAQRGSRVTPLTKKLFSLEK